MNNKIIDLDALTEYDTNIKNYIDNKINIALGGVESDLDEIITGEPSENETDPIDTPPDENDSGNI